MTSQTMWLKNTSNRAIDWCLVVAAAYGIITVALGTHDVVWGHIMPRTWWGEYLRSHRELWPHMSLAAVNSLWMFALAGSLSAMARDRSGVRHLAVIMLVFGDYYRYAVYPAVPQVAELLPNWLADYPSSMWYRYAHLSGVGLAVLVGACSVRFAQVFPKQLEESDLARYEDRHVRDDFPGTAKPIRRRQLRFITGRPLAVTNRLVHAGGVTRTAIMIFVVYGIATLVLLPAIANQIAGRPMLAYPVWTSWAFFLGVGIDLAGVLEATVRAVWIGLGLYAGWLITYYMRVSIHIGTSAARRQLGWLLAAATLLLFYLLWAAVMIPFPDHWLNPHGTMIGDLAITSALLCVSIAIFLVGAFDPAVVLRPAAMYGPLYIGGVFTFASAEDIAGKLLLNLMPGNTVLPSWLAGGFTAVLLFIVSRLIKERAEAAKHRMAALLGLGSELSAKP